MADETPQIYGSSVLAYASVYSEAASRAAASLGVPNFAVIGCVLEEANGRNVSWQ